MRLLSRKPIWLSTYLTTCSTRHRSFPTTRCLSTARDQGMSFSKGSTAEPLLEVTIPQHFADIVAQYGDRPAVLARSPTAPGRLPPITQSLTYHELDLESNRLARSLRSFGVAKGDRVAISLGNTLEYASLTYALYKLGAILVPLNPTFNDIQLTSALAFLNVKILIMGVVTDIAFKPTQGRLNLPLLQKLVPDLEKEKVEAPKIPSLQKIIVLDNAREHGLDFPHKRLRTLTPYTDLLHASPSSTSPPVTPSEPLHPLDIINIQFTSGTTSQPKAAMLSHRNLLNNGQLIAQRMGITPDDRIVVPPPLFHCFGSILGYMATATTGASIHFPSPAFDPVASLDMAAEQDATGLYGVSTMLVAMIDRLDQGFVKSKPLRLRTGIVAGSSVPEALMKRLFDRLGLHEMVIAYGMTETSPISCMTTPTDPFEKRIGTVGRVMPHTTVKVVDPSDRSKTLPIGSKGEFAASGYLVMKGYWEDEARTREAMEVDADGVCWMYSGDEAYMDEDGYVHITGRIKDLIIRGGENIHPLEIENSIFQYPLVEDVSVVGVPDAKYGESVAAFVIPRPGVVTLPEDAELPQEAETQLHPQQIRAFVRENLSRHLVPKHIFFVKDFPKTASGKIQKYELRARGRRNLGIPVS